MMKPLRVSIEQAFENIPDEMFKMLLSHRPEQFDVYAEAGIDVTFSGHAHGGQFRIPGSAALFHLGKAGFLNIHRVSMRRMAATW